MFHIISYVSNIFQTVYPQVLDSWMSHFDSQLQNYFVRDGKPEVPALGVDVLSPEGHQDLHLGAVVPAVQEGVVVAATQPTTQNNLKQLWLGGGITIG